MIEEIYKGQVYRIGPDPGGCSGIRWMLPIYDRFGVIVHWEVSSGGFYDGCIDHPEGAVEWARRAVRTKLDRERGGGMKIAHLTLTGYYAGAVFCGTPKTLCGAPKTTECYYVHAAYAPLENPEFRARVCKACLAVWESDPDDDTNTTTKLED